MGIKISSLAQIPADLEMKYYIYLLTSEFPYSYNTALENSLEILARNARAKDFIVIKGLVGEFGGEVMNAHSVDGLESDETLPAILISSVNPHKFKQARSIDRNGPFKEQERVIIISLKEEARTEDDVYKIVETILNDILKGEELSEFEINNAKRTRFIDALVLEPNFSGVGIKLKTLWEFLSKK